VDKSLLTWQAIAYFWSKVDVLAARDTRCWNYRGGKNSRGYGKHSLPSENGPATEGAHRIAFAIAAGISMTSEDYICHHCDNPSCCNPAHLFKGTALENNRDAYAKGRNLIPSQRPGFIPVHVRNPHHYAHRGADSPSAKLTEDQAWSLLHERANGASVPDLAAKYGMSKEGVGGICAGRKWRHLFEQLPAEVREAIRDTRNQHKTYKKLSPDTLADIRARLAAGVSVRALAERHKVSKALIYQIRSGRAHA